MLQLRLYPLSIAWVAAYAMLQLRLWTGERRTKHTTAITAGYSVYLTLSTALSICNSYIYATCKKGVDIFLHKQCNYWPLTAITWHVWHGSLCSIQHQIFVICSQCMSYIIAQLGIWSVPLFSDLVPPPTRFFLCSVSIHTAGHVYLNI